MSTSRRAKRNEGALLHFFWAAAFLAWRSMMRKTIPLIFSYVIIMKAAVNTVCQLERGEPRGLKKTHTTTQLQQRTAWPRNRETVHERRHSTRTCKYHMSARSATYLDDFEQHVQGARVLVWHFLALGVVGARAGLHGAQAALRELDGVRQHRGHCKARVNS